MKRLAVLMAALFALATACSRTRTADCPQPPPDDWSWIFQRDGETCGLLFEDTGLSASVKAAIRDDVCRSYSFVTASNLFTRLYVPGDPEYGTFVGRDGTMGNNGGATGLGGWQYKLHNGTRYLHVKKELSEKFLQAIALTNQHKAAAGSLTNFLHAFNSTTTNNLNLSAYLPMWWSMKQEKPLSMTFSMWGDGPDFKSEAEVMEFCAEFHQNEIIVPSILNFRYEASLMAGKFGCETVFRHRESGVYEQGWPLIYRKGKWRVAFPEF